MMAGDQGDAVAMGDDWRKESTGDIVDLNSQGKGGAFELSSGHSESVSAKVDGCDEAQVGREAESKGDEVEGEKEETGFEAESVKRRLAEWGSVRANHVEIESNAGAKEELSSLVNSSVERNNFDMSIQVSEEGVNARGAEEELRCTGQSEGAKRAMELQMEEAGGINVKEMNRSEEEPDIQDAIVVDESEKLEAGERAKERHSRSEDFQKTSAEAEVCQEVVDLQEKNQEGKREGEDMQAEDGEKKAGGGEIKRAELDMAKWEAEQVKEDFQQRLRENRDSAQVHESEEQNESYKISFVANETPQLKEGQEKVESVYEEIGDKEIKIEGKPPKAAVEEKEQNLGGEGIEQKMIEEERLETSEEESNCQDEGIAYKARNGHEKDEMEQEGERELEQNGTETEFGSKETELQLKDTESEAKVLLDLPELEKIEVKEATWKSEGGAGEREDGKSLLDGNAEAKETEVEQALEGREAEQKLREEKSTLIAGMLQPEEAEGEVEQGMEELRSERKQVLAEEDEQMQEEVARLEYNEVELKATNMENGANLVDKHAPLDVEARLEDKEKMQSEIDMAVGRRDKEGEDERQKKAEDKGRIGIEKRIQGVGNPEGNLEEQTAQLHVEDREEMRVMAEKEDMYEVQEVQEKVESVYEDIGDKEIKIEGKPPKAVVEEKEQNMGAEGIEQKMIEEERLETSEEESNGQEEGIAYKARNEHEKAEMEQEGERELEQNGTGTEFGSKETELQLKDREIEAKVLLDQPELEEIEVKEATWESEGAGEREDGKSLLDGNAEAKEAEVEQALEEREAEQKLRVEKPTVIAGMLQPEEAEGEVEQGMEELRSERKQVLAEEDEQMKRQEEVAQLGYNEVELEAANMKNGASLVDRHAPLDVEARLVEILEAKEKMQSEVDMAVERIDREGEDERQKKAEDKGRIGIEKRMQGVGNPEGNLEEQTAQLHVEDREEMRVMAEKEDMYEVQEIGDNVNVTIKRDESQNSFRDTNQELEESFTEQDVKKEEHEKEVVKRIVELEPGEREVEEKGEEEVQEKGVDKRLREQISEMVVSDMKASLGLNEEVDKQLEEEHNPLEGDVVLEAIVETPAPGVEELGEKGKMLKSELELWKIEFTDSETQIETEKEGRVDVKEAGDMEKLADLDLVMEEDESEQLKVKGERDLERTGLIPFNQKEAVSEVEMTEDELAEGKAEFVVSHAENDKYKQSKEVREMANFHGRQEFQPEVDDGEVKGRSKSEDLESEGQEMSETLDLEQRKKPEGELSIDNGTVTAQIEVLEVADRLCEDNCADAQVAKCAVDFDDQPPQLEVKENHGEDNMAELAQAEVKETEADGGVAGKDTEQPSRTDVRVDESSTECLSYQQEEEKDFVNVIGISEKELEGEPSESEEKGGARNEVIVQNGQVEEREREVKLTGAELVNEEVSAQQQYAGKIHVVEVVRENILIELETDRRKLEVAQEWNEMSVADQNLQNDIETTESKWTQEEKQVQPDLRDVGQEASGQQDQVKVVEKLGDKILEQGNIGRTQDEEFTRIRLVETAGKESVDEPTSREAIKLLTEVGREEEAVEEKHQLELRTSEANHSIEEAQFVKKLTDIAVGKRESELAVEGTEPQQQQSPLVENTEATNGLSHPELKEEEQELKIDERTPEAGIQENQVQQQKGLEWDVSRNAEVIGLQAGEVESREVQAIYTVQKGNVDVEGKAQDSDLQETKVESVKDSDDNLAVGDKIADENITLVALGDMTTFHEVQERRPKNQDQELVTDRTDLPGGSRQMNEDATSLEGFQRIAKVGETASEREIIVFVETEEGETERAINIANEPQNHPAIKGSALGYDDGVENAALAYDRTVAEFEEGAMVSERGEAGDIMSMETGVGMAGRTREQSSGLLDGVDGHGKVKLANCDRKEDATVDIEAVQATVHMEGSSEKGVATRVPEREAEKSNDVAEDDVQAVVEEVIKILQSDAAAEGYNGLPNCVLDGNQDMQTDVKESNTTLEKNADSKSAVQHGIPEQIGPTSESSKAIVGVDSLNDWQGGSISELNMHSISDSKPQDPVTNVLDLAHKEHVSHVSAAIDLSVECLAAIFSRLNTAQECLNFALVCKAWHDIAFQSRTTLRLERGKRTPLAAIQQLLRRCPNLTQLEFPGKSLDSPVSDSFLAAIGSSCRRLVTLIIGPDSELGHTFSHSGLDCIFQSCQELVELTLEGLAERATEDRAPIAIPESLGCLTALQKLTLAGKHSKRSSGRQGGRTLQLPESLGKLQQLQVLALTFSSPPALPSSIWSLTNLKVLRLHGWQGILFLPDCLDDLKSLEVLDLKCSDLVDLPSSAATISTLRELIWETASSSELVGEDTSVPPSLGLFTQLASLQLRNVVHLPHVLPNLPNLTSLEVWGAVSSFEMVPSSLCSFENLKRLRLRGNFQKLPQSLGQLTSLEHLILTSSALDSIPYSIAGLWQLKELRLDGCGINPRLPDTLWDLPNLQILSIPCEFLSEKVGKLVSLTHLNVECETERSLPFNGLPSNIGHLSELRELRALCPYMKSLPRTFVALTSLQSLQLVWDGALPAAFGQLLGLKKLVLDSERMSWLPDSFGQLTALHTLILVCRKLNSLPETFADLQSLRILSIRGCDYLCTLPDNFCDLVGLETLESDCPNLLRLPAAFGRMTSLQRLEIWSKRLSRLPESFGYIWRLNKVELRCPRLWELPASVKLLPMSVQETLAKAVEEAKAGSENLSDVRSVNLDVSKEALTPLVGRAISLEHTPTALFSPALRRTLSLTVPGWGRT